MEHSKLILSITILLLLVASSESVTFNCTGSATCQGLAGYVPAKNTTYGAILSLFQTPTLLHLLAANNLPRSTPASYPIAARSTVRVPFPCACAAGIGRSDHTPIYTVKPTDNGLDDIARLTFDFLITYQEIAEANGIPNPDIIKKGEKLWIPLPCSCDAVNGEDVVHLAHLVEPGSSIDIIAEQFGTSPETLLRINGIGDPLKLQAGQAIDVPLKACSSSISNASPDSNLRLPNGSYALTADDCIQCTCSAASAYQLTCHSIEGRSKSCGQAKCENQLLLGNASKSGCEQTTCAYAGYTKSAGSSSPTILTKTISQSLCNEGATPTPAPSSSVGGSPPGSNNANRRTILQVNLTWLLMFITVIFI